jgi:hypothetical protein
VYLSQVLRDLDVLHEKSLRYTLYVYAFWIYFFKLPAYIAINKKILCFSCLFRGQLWERYVKLHEKPPLGAVRGLCALQFTINHRKRGC